MVSDILTRICRYLSYSCFVEWIRSFYLISSRMLREEPRERRGYMVGIENAFRRTKV
jgi:hypothetical protein